MRHLSIALMATLVLVLAGCGSVNAPRGGTDRGVAVLPPEVTSYIAADVARQLSGKLLPAKTPLRLARPSRGAFEISLVSALRATGYAVAEPADIKQARQATRDSEPLGVYSEGLFSTPVLSVSSQLIRVETDLHVARVDVGNHRISRAYVVTPEGATPAGAWTYKE